MRFLGLADPGNSVYSSYRIPDPEAPYPQDVIIGPDGTICYWAGEYEPQEILAKLDELLGTPTSVPDEPVDDLGDSQSVFPRWSIQPHPVRSRARVTLQGAPGAGTPALNSIRVQLLSSAGRRVEELMLRPTGDGGWSGELERGDLPAGVYWIRADAADSQLNGRLVVVR